MGMEPKELSSRCRRRASKPKTAVRGAYRVATDSSIERDVPQFSISKHYEGEQKSALVTCATSAKRGNRAEEVSKNIHHCMRESHGVLSELLGPKFRRWLVYFLMYFTSQEHRIWHYRNYRTTKRGDGYAIGLSANKGILHQVKQNETG